MCFLLRQVTRLLATNVKYPGVEHISNTFPAQYAFVSIHLHMYTLLKLTHFLGFAFKSNSTRSSCSGESGEERA